MIKTTVQVEGMMCGMCESHVNDAVRKACQVEKVTSSRGKGETVILSQQPLEEAALKAAINATGYEVKGITSEPYEKKKGFFPFYISDFRKQGLPLLLLTSCLCEKPRRMSTSLRTNLGNAVVKNVKLW